MTDFRFTTEFDVRYRDLDPIDHVNNAVYATYLETARLEYLQEAVGETLATGEAVIAHLSIDFRRPITFGETVTVGVATTDFGRSSVHMDYEVRTDGDLAATAETVLVTVEDGEPTAVSEEWRADIEAFEGGIGED